MRFLRAIVWRILWWTCCRWLWHGPQVLRRLSWAVLPTVGSLAYRPEEPLA